MTTKDPEEGQCVFPTWEELQALPPGLRHLIIGLISEDISVFRMLFLLMVKKFGKCELTAADIEGMPHLSLIRVQYKRSPLGLAIDLQDGPEAAEAFKAMVRQAMEDAIDVVQPKEGKSEFGHN